MKVTRSTNMKILIMIIKYIYYAYCITFAVQYVHHIMYCKTIVCNQQDVFLTVPRLTTCKSYHSIPSSGATLPLFSILPFSMVADMAVVYSYIFSLATT